MSIRGKILVLGVGLALAATPPALAQCEDNNSCTTDTLVNGACVHTPVPDGRFCIERWSACTPNPFCQAGICQPGPPANCNDGNPCTDDVCGGFGGSGCHNRPRTGQLCEKDGNPCTIDRCTSGGTCQFDIITLENPCDDGNPCTEDDQCVYFAICRGTERSCPVDDPCTEGFCDPADNSCHVRSRPTGGSCNDGNKCTFDDRCDAAGTCGGTGVSCPPDGPCTRSFCDATDGACHLESLPSGDPCDDGNACTVADVCDDAGFCVGSAMSCPSKSPCTRRFCDPSDGTCHVENRPAGTSCDDLDPCTAADRCDGAGACAGTPYDPDHDGRCGVDDPCPLDPDDDGDGDGLCANEDNCPEVSNPDQTDGDTTRALPMWATSATASSSFGEDDYGPGQATGAPQTPGLCADFATAWSPLTDGLEPEWIELTYAEPVRAVGVDVVENQVGGFVTQVELRDEAGAWHVAWSGTDTTACGGMFSPRWRETIFLVQGARITTQAPGWEEIDAVALVWIHEAPQPDGVGDACDVCPGAFDPGQEDADGDGVGDACTSPASLTHRPASKRSGSGSLLRR